MPTTLPGFHNPTHDAQQTFRVLLEAMARPGQPFPLATHVGTPAGLTPALAAACLTLLDLETWVWLPSGLEAAIAPWLVFHTGCRMTPHPQFADFALISDIQTLPTLTAFNWGTVEQPEASTTLLISVEAFEAGQAVVLQGPGIQGEREIAPRSLPAWFWTEWQTSTQSYPQGVDVFLFTPDAVMGLPRTVKVRE
jgi:alpha-D-ribose 1-methylphosphonate 5-triphosphate synthase subunit PhnH